MSFTSINFIALVLILAFLYYCLPRKVQWILLLIGSLLFYITYGIEKLPFILAASLLTYLAARKMDKIYILQDAYIKENELAGKEKQTYVQGNKKKTKCILVWTVLLLVLLLIYAKAGKWVQEIVTGLAFDEPREIIPVIIALGVSYYTFSMIAYVADVYWRKEQAEKNYFRFLLFAIYFPKILQGPISRHRNLAPQFAEKHEFDYENFCFGIQLALWGFFKKLVIADRLSMLVTKVFGGWESYSGSVLLLATIFGAFQLYCDFSGCMDIARGVSQMFGIELEKNFERPFFSRSAAEFWRRWHITLGTWFKDYVYMPISISPKLLNAMKPIKKKWGMKTAKNIMTVIPLVAVWLLTGIWHGTGASYVVWGIYWGGIIIVSMLLEPYYKTWTAKLKINTETASWRGFQMLRTLGLFCIGRILTIPNDLSVSVGIIKKIFIEFGVWNILNENIYNYGLDMYDFNLSIVVLAILLIVSVLQEKGSVRQMIANQNLVVRWIIYYAAFFAVVIYGIYGPGYDASAFVYMNF